MMMAFGLLLWQAAVATTYDRPRAIADEWGWLADQARAPKIRTMREFSEEVIIIPDGPFKGRPFNCSRQPYSGLWFDAVDSSEWDTCVGTGPTQSGKSLTCFVIPLVYHLFEIGESVICGLPDMRMASDKWEEDILPVLLAAPELCELLPERGEGSRGGTVKNAVRFKNGTTLKFMSGGGGDKTRAGYSARVIVITETDGMDEAGEASREADKVTQILARTRAYRRKTGLPPRVYMECTVSIKEGRTWREYTGGTESRIVLPCPHCQAYVAPERDDLVGWRDVETVFEAEKNSRFRCPSCEHDWTDGDRDTANAHAILLHRGQAVSGDPPAVQGDAPHTRTLGFRWSAVNNLFVSAADVGVDEWRARHEPDEANAEKEMLQFVWALPYEPPEIDITPLSADDIKRRVAAYKRGVIPAACQYVTVGLDTGKWKCHWVAIAWEPDGTGYVIDYGVINVPSREHSLQKALVMALTDFRDFVMSGWQLEAGGQRAPDQVWIDSGWYEHTDAVYLFCQAANAGLPSGRERFRPSKGHGEGQQRSTVYTAPKAVGKTVRRIGEEYYLGKVQGKRIVLVHVNADHWKSRVHQSLGTPADSPGSLILFDGLAAEHYEFARHITAEKQVEEYIDGKGTRIIWERVRRANHYLDAAYNAAAAGHFCGVRSVPTEAPDEVVPAGGWFSEQRRKRGRR
jgi:phage terminase large subunit GpA-like protein